MQIKLVVVNDRREQCRVCLTICEAGGIFCETMGGGVHRDTETLTLSAAQTHKANVMGVRPPGFEVFCIRKCGSTSNACLCFVYVRSGRILFALQSCVYLAEVQISTAVNTRRNCQFEMLYEQNVEINVTSISN